MRSDSSIAKYTDKLHKREAHKRNETIIPAYWHQVSELSVCASYHKHTPHLEKTPLSTQTSSLNHIKKPKTFSDIDFLSYFKAEAALHCYEQYDPSDIIFPALSTL